MDPNYNNPAPPQPPPPPLPPQPPIQPYAPPPPPAPDSQQYQSGGMVMGKINWVQVGFLFLGAFAMYNIIDFYRKKAKAEKQSQATVAELKQKQDTLETNFYGFVSKFRRRA
jgi:hypothetical protein